MDSLISLIVQWNNDWKYDYLWRKKYKIPFNSVEHRSASPLDVRFDILEEQLIRDQISKEEKYKKDYDDYKKTGEWWKSSEEIGDEKAKEKEDELFDNLDLEDLDL